MTIDVGTLTAQEQVTAIYVAYYDRAPDPFGLNFWTGKLNSGELSLTEIANFFADAAETKLKYAYFEAPSLAGAAEFINEIYQNLFNRAPDAEGAAFWIEQLESGAVPPGEFILAVLAGAQDVEGGTQDKSTIENKLDVALDWTITALNKGVGTSSNPFAQEIDGQFVVIDQEVFDSATSILDGVTGDPATVEASMATTAAFFAELGVPPTYTLEATGTSIIEGNDGTVQMVFTLTLSEAPTKAVTVNFQTTASGIGADGQATAGEDFIAGAGAVVFAAGQTVATVTVIVKGDVDIELDETVEVTFSGAALAAPVTATASILNDDLQSNQTFTLTEGSDQIPGLIGSAGTTDNTGDNLILAGTSSTGGLVANTLGSGDNLDGGTGYDTLRVISGSGAPLDPTVSNVERFYIQALANSSLNLVNVTDVQELWNFRSTDDISVTNVQAPTIVGVEDSNSGIDLTYRDGLDLGGQVTIAVNGAGVVGNGAVVQIDSDDAANLTDLNILTGPRDSYLLLDVDDGGVGAEFETATLSGAGGLFLGELNGQGETEFLTTVNAVGLEGFLELNLSLNNQDINFDGGAGDTTLSTGNGDSDIMTGVGDDFIVVGNGDNVINTGAGSDSVIVGNLIPSAGDNLVDTGADNDFVDISNFGNQTVALGGGDDTLDVDTALDEFDAVEAGDGIDTLIADVNSAAGFTADGDVDAVVNGFEALVLTGTVDESDNRTVDLDNIDDIADVTISANVETGSAVAEVQFLQFLDNSSAFPATITIEGVVIEIAPGSTAFQIADLISTNFATQIIDAYNANHPGEVMTGLNSFNFSDQIQFEFARASGDTPPVAFTADTGLLSAGALFGLAATTVAGTDPVNEVQTLSINTAATTNGNVTIDFDNAVDGGFPVSVALVGGETTIDSAVRINSAINSAGLTKVTASVVGSVITLTYNAVALGVSANVAQATYAAGATGSVAVAGTTTAGVPFVVEKQTVSVAAGTDSDGGYVRIDLPGSTFIDLEVPANLSADQLGVFIISQQAVIQGAIPEIASINYNSATNLLTFGYTAKAGNVSPIVVSNTPGSFTDVSGLFQEFNGIDGSLGGVLTIDNMASGGSVTLDSVIGSFFTGGEIIVQLTAQTAADSLNVTIDDGFIYDGVTGDGLVTFDGVETLAMDNATGTRKFLNLEGSDAETISVTGSGVQFLQSFSSLTLVDASGLTVDVSDDGVVIVSTNGSGTTFIGSIGEDFFVGAGGADVMTGGASDDVLDGNAGKDTISGGDGEDFIDGGLAADVLTGGAGDDTFHYDAVADSQGVTVDTITDFVSGDDTIDLSFITGGFGSYTGEANGYGAVLTSLANSGNAQGVLDISTSTLYVDIDGNGILDNQDMAIDLTGVTDLANSDFNW